MTGQKPTPKSPPSYYPPCILRRSEERRLHQRLRRVWDRTSETWDHESRSAWFHLIEKATLAPSTIVKVTSHVIAKLVTADPENITWAHFVILKAIFKTDLFASKKIVSILRNKFPSANYNSNNFSESFRQPRPESVLKREPTPSTALMDLGRSASKESHAEAARVSEKNMESAESHQPDASTVPAVTTPRRPLPASRPKIKAEPAEETQKSAPAPTKKRKRTTKAEDAVPLKAPELEPADSDPLGDQELPAVAQDSHESPNVPAVAKDCRPDGNKPTPVKIEQPDVTVGEGQLAATLQKCATRAPKPRLTAKAQNTDLRETVAAKFAEIDATTSRLEQKLAKQAGEIKRLKDESRSMRSAQRRVRHWVTIAQRDGVPVPPRVWSDLKKKYKASKASK